MSEEGNALIAGRDRAAASIAVHLAPLLHDALVLTHSSSATVREAVLHTEDEPELRDTTSPELVDEIVTEEGPVVPADVNSVIGRTPFLRDGYRLLMP